MKKTLPAIAAAILLFMSCHINPGNDNLVTSVEPDFCFYFFSKTGEFSINNLHLTVIYDDSGTSDIDIGSFSIDDSYPGLVWKTDPLAGRRRLL
jgi:hypothetical protein